MTKFVISAYVDGRLQQQNFDDSPVHSEAALSRCLTAEQIKMPSEVITNTFWWIYFPKFISCERKGRLESTE